MGIKVEKRRWRIISAMVIVGVIMGAVFFVSPMASASAAEKKVVVGSKYFTENELFARITALYLEEKGYEVEKKLNLPGSLALLEGMKKGDIDLYYDYTGTLTESVLGMNLTGRGINDAEVFYEKGKKGMEEKYGFTLAKNLTYEHKYTMTVRKSTAEKLGLENTSDLAPYASNMTMATDEETLTRPDGYPKVKELYGIEFGEVRSMDIMLAYEALKKGEIDALIGLSMDPRQYAYNVTNLKDDKGWQPRYNPVPVIRMETLNKYPKLEDRLNELVPHLTREKMLKNCYKVVIEKKDAEEVAHDFLVEEGLIAKERVTPTPKPAGFEAIFAIAGLSTIAFLLMRRKKWGKG